MTPRTTVSNTRQRVASVAGVAGRTRAAAWCAWALCALTLALTLGFIPLQIQWHAFATAPRTPPQYVALLQTTTPHVIADAFAHVTLLLYATLGALIVSRQPGNRIGWIYCLIGVIFAAHDFTGYYAVSALVLAPGALPGGLALAWVQHWLWIVAWALAFVFMPLLYPTGRLPSRLWRPVGAFAFGFLATATLVVAFAPGPLANYLIDFQMEIPNPLGIAALAPVMTILSAIGFPLLLLLTLASAFSLVARLRWSRGDEREQLKWFAYVAVPALVLFVITATLAQYLPGQAALTVPVNLAGAPLGAAMPLLTGLAILKYRLYDIDLLINRTLVYAALTACVVGLYVLVVGGLGVLLQAPGSLPLSILATGLVALLVQPLRERLQRAVNRLLYGERDDPYALLTRLGSRLDATLAPSAILPTIVQTVQDALHLPYVAIARQQGEECEVTAAVGKPVADTLRLPLAYQGETVGQFLLGPRAQGEAFSPTDRRLLDGLARQVGIGVHAAQLTADLQRRARAWSWQGKRSAGASGAICMMALAPRLPLNRSN